MRIVVNRAVALQPLPGLPIAVHNTDRCQRPVRPEAPTPPEAPVTESAEARWQLLEPAEGAPRPAKRDGHSAVVDAASRRLLVFGGEGGRFNFLNDVWAFGLEAKTWEELGTAGPRPGFGTGAPRRRAFGLEERGGEEAAASLAPGGRFAQELPLPWLRLRDILEDAAEGSTGEENELPPFTATFVLPLGLFAEETYALMDLGRCEYTAKVQQMGEEVPNALIYNEAKLTFLSNSAEAYPSDKKKASFRAAILEAKFRLKSCHSPIRVVTTHLPGKPFGPARREFCKCLKTMLAKDKQPTLLLADLNFPEEGSLLPKRIDSIGIIPEGSKITAGVFRARQDAAGAKPPKPCELAEELLEGCGAAVELLESRLHEELDVKTLAAMPAKDNDASPLAGNAGSALLKAQQPIPKKTEGFRQAQQPIPEETESLRQAQALQTGLRLESEPAGSQETATGNVVIGGWMRLMRLREMARDAALDDVPCADEEHA
ncbi:unnamed protein product [Symbiodinium natans]|uniref:Uncharacterized protein n=1 Tax=Symbiodinium natans TaxID=878477 RepID=A0A812RM70_9DINO|nr:unnamed protein product [Symbiodinium natans]